MEKQAINQPWDEFCFNIEVGVRNHVLTVTGIGTPEFSMKFDCWNLPFIQILSEFQTDNCNQTILDVALESDAKLQSILLNNKFFNPKVFACFIGAFNIS